MRILKIFLLMFVITVPTIAIAEDHHVITGNKDISCMLHTIGPADLLKMISNKKVSGLELYKDYLPVQVTIKNNSKDTITMDKNTYLTRLEDFLIPKEAFNKLVKEQIDKGSIYLACLWSWLFYYFGKTTFQADHISLLRLIPTAIFGRWALENIVYLLGLKKAYVDREIKVFDDNDSTYCVDLGKHMIITFENSKIKFPHYKFTQSTLKHEVKSGYEFRDLFFIERKTFPENFLEQLPIKLAYEVCLKREEGHV